MQILEHIHLNVDSLAKSRDFLQAAVPHIVVRGGGNAPGYGPWLHIGDDCSYIALTEVPGTRSAPELRHIGLVVDDIESLITRLQSAGYAPADASELNSHPWRKRVYYIDGNGVDWEFVQYLSEEIHERNDYSL